MVRVLAQNADLVIFLFLTGLGYTAGSIAERRHYRSISRRETELLRLPVVTLKNPYPEEALRGGVMVMGSVVISIDYFKRLLAILRNIFGGRVTSYESLVDRARREAILRLKDAASRKGCDIVVNLRLETSTIGQSANNRNSVGCVEVLAYGTAISLRRP
jgi:uncharacterized protein YbjQ (UPF0145 family)